MTSNGHSIFWGDDENVLELVVMVVHHYECPKPHCTGVILWDANYTSVKNLTQRAGISPMDERRILGGHREVSIAPVLELKSDLGKHRGLVPKDCVMWYE